MWHLSCVSDLRTAINNNHGLVSPKTENNAQWNFLQFQCFLLQWHVTVSRQTVRPSCWLNRWYQHRYFIEKDKGEIMMFVSGCEDCTLCLVVMGLWTVAITLYSKHNMFKRLDLSLFTWSSEKTSSLTDPTQQIAPSPAQNSTVFEIWNSSNTKRTCQFIPYSYTISHSFVEGLKVNYHSIF
jgi:hypothetical protein